MIRSTTILMLGALCSTALTSYTPPAAKCADLEVKSISEPEWHHDDNQTVVYVEIKNTGKLEAGAFKVKLYDVDMSPEEGKKLGLEDYLIELLEENQARSTGLKEEPKKGENPLTSVHTFFSDEYATEYDYDRYWQVVEDVNSLGKGKTIKIKFVIEGHWVYDSNCELGVSVDIEDSVKECKEENNQDYFFAWG